MCTFFIIFLRSTYVCHNILVCKNIASCKLGIDKNK